MSNFSLKPNLRPPISINRAKTCKFVSKSSAQSLECTWWKSSDRWQWLVLRKMAYTLQLTFWSRNFRTQSFMIKRCRGRQIWSKKTKRIRYAWASDHINKLWKTNKKLSRKTHTEKHIPVTLIPVLENRNDNYYNRIFHWSKSWKRKRKLNWKWAWAALRDLSCIKSLHLEYRSSQKLWTICKTCRWDRDFRSSLIFKYRENYSMISGTRFRFSKAWYTKRKMKGIDLTSIVAKRIKIVL